MSAQLRSLSRSARRALVGLCAALFLAVSAHSVLASLVIDLRFSGGATTQDITGMSASQTVVVEVWATVTGADTLHTNDGLTFTYFGLLSANTDTTHLAGNLTNASVVLPPFTDATSFLAGTFGDRNADTIGDWRGTTTNSIASGWAKASFALSSPQLGGGAVGQAAGPNGWAFHIADAVFQIGSISTAGIVGTQNVLTFNPVIPTPSLPSTRASWLEDNVTRNGTSGPTLGTTVTFTLTASGSPDIDPTPTSVNFPALLLNAQLPPPAPITLTNNGTQPGSYSTSTTGVAVVTSGATGGPIAPSGTAPMGVGLAGGTTTTYGLNKVGTVVVGTTGDPDNAATDTVSVSVNVGEGNTTGASFAGALILTGNVNAAGGYAGLASRTTTGGGPGPGNVGTEARLLGGSNATGGAELVSMQWRQRSVNERGTAQGGTPTSPPLLATVSGDPSVLISDVVNLTGLAAADTSQNSPGHTKTDMYVLQMTYDENQLTGGAGTEGAKRAAASIYLAWLNPNGGGVGIPQWENAVNGDFANNPGALFNFNGDYAAAGSPTTVGSWGVDTLNNLVWAVLDHASEFSVVPEPSSVALLGLGAIGLLVGLRRRRR